MEKIYTIPVNEAFEASEADHACGCPFCTLYRKLENDQLELILGASMMEPDVRIKTNEMGFCKTHYDMMFTRKNRLGMALMLESHLNQLREETSGGGFAALKGIGVEPMKRLEKLEQQPADRWNTIIKTMLTAVVSALAGGFAAMLIK